MENSTDKPLSHRPRSGSETRRKERRISLRVLPDEYKQVETAAAGAGLTIASYARLRLVDTPHTRSRRRPLVDVAALARTLGQLNKVGSNINQIAHAINLGETPLTRDIHDTLGGIREVLAAIREAMGLRGK